MMTHVDPFDLAALAAGGDADTAVRSHLASCAECRDALRSWERTAAAPTADERPSSHVWAGVSEELGLALGPPVDGEPAGDVPRSAADTSAPHGIVELDARRHRFARALWSTGLVAAGVVIALIGVAIGTRLAAPPAPEAPQVLAQAELAPLPGWDDSGKAILEVTAAGGRYLTVNLPGSVPTGEVREVWLMRSDLGALISVGLMEDHTGRFALPAGVDLSVYDIVDVSAEPLDGNPAHSGDSIVRGQLQTR